MISLGDLIIRLCDTSFGAIESVRRWLRRPSVETISTDKLHSLMASEDLSLVLLDARSPSEQVVSRIPGAITQEEYEANSGSLANKQVIVYCTVGGRSYLYARKLAAHGIDAKNYRDGILGWCRAGLPLETQDGQPTTAIHTYWRIFHVPDQYDVQT